MARQIPTDTLPGRPTLEELLADEVTRAVMRADRIAPREVRGLCNAVGRLLRRRRGWMVARPGGSS